MLKERYLDDGCRWCGSQEWDAELADVEHARDCPSRDIVALMLLWEEAAADVVEARAIIRQLHDQIAEGDVLSGRGYCCWRQWSGHASSCPLLAARRYLAGQCQAKQDAPGAPETAGKAQDPT